MRRLLASTRTDLELQARNGLYYATGFVLLVTIATLATLPPTGLARLLPAFALNTLGVTAFYFSAALALLEHSEGSDMARAVTPLRPGEYLGARVATLVLLALVQHLSVGVVLLGPAPGLAALAVGVSLTAAILALGAFALAAGKRSFSTFLLPSVPWVALLLAPMAADVLEWRHPLLWLHPIYGPLTLMRAAVAPAATWELALGTAAGLAWTYIAFELARRAYDKARTEEIHSQ